METSTVYYPNLRKQLDTPALGGFRAERGPFGRGWFGRGRSGAAAGSRLGGVKEEGARHGLSQEPVLAQLAAKQASAGYEAGVEDVFSIQHQQDPVAQKDEIESGDRDSSSAASAFTASVNMNDQSPGQEPVQTGQLNTGTTGGQSGSLWQESPTPGLSSTAGDSSPKYMPPGAVTSRQAHSRPVPPDIPSPGKPGRIKSKKKGRK